MLIKRDDEMKNSSTPDVFASETEKILQHFHNRCVRCKKPAKVVHEIIPRSRRPRTWMAFENRVPLCENCHFWAHKHGAKSSADELRRLRDEFEQARA